MVKELNLSPTASQIHGSGFTARREEHHPGSGRIDGTSGSRTHRSPRFELGRFAGLRIVPCCAVLSSLIRCKPAPPRGFEPLISTLTGWRELQLLRRGKIAKALRHVDCNPTKVASISKSPWLTDPISGKTVTGMVTGSPLVRHASRARSSRRFSAVVRGGWCSVEIDQFSTDYP